MIQNQATIFNLNTTYGLIQLQGNDPLQFLQGLLTCDMQELKTKDHCWGAFCNTKGRVRALFRIFKQQNENSLFLLTVKELIPLMIPALKKYAMFSKIAVTDASKKFTIWGITGISHGDLMQFLQTAHPASYFSILNLADKMFRAIIIGPENFNLTGNFLEGNDDEWKRLDIYAGFPEVWGQTAEKFLPHHLNLPTLGAVSFTKGCYCGQEIVARMEYKGNIKVGLKYIEIDVTNISAEDKSNKFLPGSECEFGTIVSVSHSKEQNKFKMLVICHY